jgi:hypothetical protein
MNIMCPQKFKGPTKFLRHTLDLGTTHSSPLTDPGYPGWAQRSGARRPPHSPPPFGSLEEQVTKLHFLADRIPVLYLHKSLYEYSIRHRLTHSHLPRGLDLDTRPHPGSYFHVPTTVAFYCIFLKIEVCDFPSSFPLFYLLNVWRCGRVFNFATTVTVSFSFFNILELGN